MLEEYDITVELGTQLVSLEQYSDRVTAHITKKIDGKEVAETATFDWLVGADGAHSVVRKQLGIPFLGVTREAEQLVVGDIHVKKGLENRMVRLRMVPLEACPDALSLQLWPFWGNNWLEKMYDPLSTTFVLNLSNIGCRVAMRPFEIEDDDRFNFMIGGSEIDHAKTASSREELLKTFYEVSGRTDIEFGELLWMGLWRLVQLTRKHDMFSDRLIRPNIRMVDRFGEGRVFIVGGRSPDYTLFRSI